MKIARATKEDMDAAAGLVSVLNTVDDGYYPSTEDEYADAPTFFDADDKDHLRLFYDKVMGHVEASPGGLLRVIWGFGSAMDPRNEIFDQEDEALTLHPRICRALEIADRFAWVPVTERLPLEEDGTVVVKLKDGSILTAWATYWHGASNEFAQWTFPYDDEDRAEVVSWAYLPKDEA